MKLLDLIPGWVYAIAIALLVAAAGWFYVGKIKAEGELATYRAEVAENTRKAEADARARERSMQRQNERILREQSKKQEELAERAADVDRAAGSLRDEITRLNARGAPEDAGAAALAGEARTARELLGACAERYKDVARSADELRDQVTGLQDYASSVCKPPAEGVSQ